MLIINPKSQFQNGWVVLHEDANKTKDPKDIVGHMKVFSNELFKQEGGHEGFTKYLDRTFIDTGLWRSYGKIWPCHIDAWRQGKEEVIDINEDEKNNAQKYMFSAEYSA